MSVPSRIADAHVNPKDPRLLRRQVSHNASKSTSSPSPEKKKSPVVRDGNIPETKVTAAPPPPPPPPLPPVPSSSDRGTMLMAILFNTIDARLLSRKRDTAATSVQQCRAAYERAQRTFSEFPLVVRQAAQNLKIAEEKFKAAQKAAEMHLATNKPQDIVRILGHEPAKQSSDFEAQRAELNDLRQELKAMQTHISSESRKSEATAIEMAKVTAELTKISSENDDLKKRALDQESTIKTLSAHVKELEFSYGEHAKTMEGHVNTVQRAMEASFKPTKTKISEFEEYRKSNQLMAKAIKSDLGAVEDRISRLEKNMVSEQDNKSRDGEIEKLRKELDRLQENCKSRDRAANATKNQVESLDKSTDAHSERIANLSAQLTDQRSEIQALGTKVDQFKSEISETLVNHQVSILTSVSKKIDDRIEPHNIELEVVKASNDRQAKEIKRIEEDLTTSLRRSRKEVGESLEASHDNAMAIGRIDDELMFKVTALEKKVLDFRNSPHPASQGSTANDSSNGAIIIRVQELETQARKHSGAIFIAGHNFRWLDNRFNNLETSQLQRSILKSVAPELRKFEQDLANIAQLYEEIREIRQIKTKLDDMMSKIEGNEHFRSEVETRSKETREKQDNMMAIISGAQSAQLTLFTETSRINEKISALSDELNELRRTIQRSENATRPSQEPDLMGFSIKGNYERTTTRRARPDRGQGGSQPRSRPSRAYDDIDSADELNPESSEQTHTALLEQLQATATKSIHSPDVRSPVPSSPLRGREVRLGKRKCSETDSPSRNDRRA